MLEVTVDPTAFISGLNNLTQNQLPWAAAQALNECALAFQAEERGVMNADFTIRRAWVTQGVKIGGGDYARKDKLEARVHIEADRDFLGKFERGGMKRPTDGSLAVAIPTTNARRTAQSIVPDRLRPKEFGFRKAGWAAAVRRGSRSSSGNVIVLQGDQRTILIQRRDGTGVILQRKGRKIAVKKRQRGPLQSGQRHDFALVPLYILRPRVRIAPRLHWAETVSRSFMSTFPSAMTRWWNEAVRTMKTGQAIQQGQVVPAGFSE